MTAEIRSKSPVNLAIKNLIKCILFTRLCLLILFPPIVYQRVATLK